MSADTKWYSRNRDRPSLYILTSNQFQQILLYRSLYLVVGMLAAPRAQGPMSPSDSTIGVAHTMSMSRFPYTYTSMTWTRFTNFAPIPVIYMNREYPTAEHCTFLRAAIARADACRRSVPSPQIPGAPT